MANNDPVRQHYVPASYLALFAKRGFFRGRKTKLWSFDKKGKNLRKNSANKLFVEKHIYTVVINGEKNYRLENSLADLEGKFVEIVNEKIHKNKPLNDREHATLCFFVAAMYLRTRGQKARLYQMRDQVIQHLRQYSDMRAPDGFTDADVEDSHRRLVATQIPEIAQELFEMNIAFLRADGGAAYITSDDPVILFNSKLRFAGPGAPGPGFKQRHIEVYMPISREVTVLFSRSNYMGYSKLSRALVHERNRWIVHHAYERIVSGDRGKKWRWFRKYPPQSPMFVARVFLHKLWIFLKKFMHKIIRR